MIKEISTANPDLLYVTNGTSMMPSIDMTATDSGLLRYNGDMRFLEVFDGKNNLWIPMQGTTVNLGFHHDFQIMVDWAREKIKEEKEWEELSLKNKSAALALENLNKSKQQMKIISHLIKENNEKSS